MELDINQYPTWMVASCIAYGFLDEIEKLTDEQFDLIVETAPNCKTLRIAEIAIGDKKVIFSLSINKNGSKPVFENGYGRFGDEQEDNMHVIHHMTSMEWDAIISNKEYRKALFFRYFEAIIFTLSWQVLTMINHLRGDYQSEGEIDTSDFNQEAMFFACAGQLCSMLFSYECFDDFLKNKSKKESMKWFKNKFDSIYTCDEVMAFLKGITPEMYEKLILFVKAQNLTAKMIKG